MIRFPIRRDIISEVITAAADRNEIYENTPAPGKFRESRYLNK
jgi:hypothetical protein